MGTLIKFELNNTYNYYSYVHEFETSGLEESTLSLSEFKPVFKTLISQLEILIKNL